MAAGIGPGARVIELGAGTGTLTEALLDNGVAPQHLQLVERNPRFVRILHRRFPEVGVHAIDAAELAVHFEAGRGQFDFIVSGLPIVWFKQSLKRAILGGAFELLTPGGRFHQFTYLGRAPIERVILRELGLEAGFAGFVPLNFPPGFVYWFERVRAWHTHGRAPYPR
jgi:phosphatidylethanolamine/phosphatidyl-N-methylethanolamine N-methyltransferase